jgi:hypothetical protein
MCEQNPYTENLSADVARDPRRACVHFPLFGHTVIIG